jgi:hypothetical protein
MTGVYAAGTKYRDLPPLILPWFSMDASKGPSAWGEIELSST